MFSKIKAIKEMRDQAKTMQSALAEIVCEGSAAWGKVKVRMNGNQEVLSVAIDPAFASDRVKVEEGVKDAVNDAVKKIHKEMAGKMKELGGLDALKNLGM